MAGPFQAQPNFSRSLAHEQLAANGPYTLAGSGRNRAAGGAARRCKVCHRCRRWLRVHHRMLPLSGHLWQVATGAAHDPDAYCAADTATTAKEARWGYHRRAVRADRSRAAAASTTRAMPRVWRWWLRTSTRTSRGCLGWWSGSFASSSTTTRPQAHARAPRARRRRRAARQRRAAAGGAAGRAAGRAAQRWRRGAALRVVRQRELRRPNRPRRLRPRRARLGAQPDGRRRTPRGDVCARRAGVPRFEWLAELRRPAVHDRGHATLHGAAIGATARRAAMPVGGARRRRLRGRARARVAHLGQRSRARARRRSARRLRLRLLCAVVASRAALRGRSRAFWGRLAAWTASPGADWPALEFAWRTIVGADERDWRGGAPCVGS